MKTNRLFLSLAVAPFFIPLASGCVFLHAPAPAPTPAPVPTPTPPFFDPKVGMPAPGQPIGKPLNAAASPILPDAFQITSPLSGDHVAIQSIDTIQVGTPPKPVVTVGTPDTVRLAGIVAPTTQPSLQLARKAITDWTVGQNLDVDLDTKYPTDLNGVRVVHIIFKGRPGPYKDVPLSLNRMMVRSGHAVVDLYSPTSFDTSQWLLDEAYAKRNRSGLWKYGVPIQQRVPIKLGPITGSKSVVTVQPTDRGPILRSATTTTQSATSSTQTTVGGASAPAVPAPAASVPAASNAASSSGATSASNSASSGG